MAAFAPIPSASDRMATTVTNGVLNSARSESLRLRMADGVRDLRGSKPIGGLGRSLRVDETLQLIRELTQAVGLLLRPPPSMVWRNTNALDGKDAAASTQAPSQRSGASQCWRLTR